MEITIWTLARPSIFEAGIWGGGGDISCIVTSLPEENQKYHSRNHWKLCGKTIKFPAIPRTYPSFLDFLQKLHRYLAMIAF